jgi:hypothetical protein
MYENVCIKFIIKMFIIRNNIMDMSFLFLFNKNIIIIKFKINEKNMYVIFTNRVLSSNPKKLLTEKKL